MKVSGKAIFNIDEISFSAMVDLLPNENKIVVNYKSNDRTTRDKDPFDRIYSINNFEAELPFGRIFSSEIPVSGCQGFSSNQSKGDSSLATAFALPGTSTKQVRLIPKYFINKFRFENDNIKSRSELLYFNNKKLFEFGLNLRIGKRKITIYGKSDYLVVFSNYNLLNLKNHLENALSCLQGGRCVYATGYYKNRLEINSRRYSLSNPYGCIFKEDSNCIDFISKYVEFSSSLTGKEKERHELFISYLFDAMNTSVYLENRMINLFIAVEIIDKSRRLDKNSLAQILGLKTEIAYFFIRMRNKLVHEGKLLKKAVTESKVETVQHYPNTLFPFTLSKSKPGKSARSSYFLCWAQFIGIFSRKLTSSTTLLLSLRSFNYLFQCSIL